MRFLGLLITLFIIGAAGLVLMKYQRPDMFYSLMISFNLIEPKLDSAAEKERLSHIRLLPVSDEKKQFLIQRTVFMGASPQMVELALGKPHQAVPGKMADGSPATQWTYQFEGDSRPTVLLFEGDKLASAFHTSAHEEETKANGSASLSLAPTVAAH